MDKKTIIKKSVRTSSPPWYQLEDAVGAYGGIGEIKSSRKYKKETIQQLKSDLSRWMLNEHFIPIKGKQLDVALVIKRNPYRLKKQDIDNIAKILCDTLKEKKGDNRYLFHDDSQIIRLLIWKIQRAEDKQSDTDSYDISFRIHVNKKPMNLTKPFRWVRIEGNTAEIVKW